MKDRYLTLTLEEEDEAGGVHKIAISLSTHVLEHCMGEPGRLLLEHYRALTLDLDAHLAKVKAMGNVPRPRNPTD